MSTMQNITQQTLGLLIGTQAAQVSCDSSKSRLSLRARGDLSALNTALGFELSEKIGDIATKDQTKALCLGPDEWVIITDQVPAIEAACKSVYEQLPHSLVDISGREITFKIEGNRASELLTLGLTRDPDTILVGTGRRVAFDGLTVVLWCNGENEYDMDVWNSFATHIFGLLETGCKELAAEPPA